MGSIIAFVAGCGGAGKTTAVINLGVSLAAHGRRVLLIDAAAGLPDLDASLGIERLINHTVSDVASGRCTATEALIQVPGAAGASVLPGAPIDDRVVTAAALRDVCGALAAGFDYILLDSPPGNEAGALAAAAVADAHVVVTQHTTQHRRGVEALLSRLRDGGLLAGHPLILFNRVTPQRAAAAGVSKADLLYGWGLEEEDIIGDIPEDEAAISAKNKGVPLVIMAPRSPAGQACAAAAERLLEQMGNLNDELTGEMEAGPDVSRS